jgi:hypothetical protein
LPDSAIKCVQCGSEVPADARTLGLCPRCLLARVIDVRKKMRQQLDQLYGPEELKEKSELEKAFGQYRIEGLLGRGGMGRVFKAFDVKRDRGVALKVLPIGEDEDVKLMGRFISEARILTELHHPNIVEAYESGQAGGFMYLAMELVEGQSLREKLASGPMKADAAVEVAMQVCDALIYAHERGILHRDIKPENIVLEEGKRVRLVDFGLARPIRNLPGASATAPHEYVGTADYVAPDSRYRRAPADARADIYSLGVVMYEMLTGKLPIGHFSPPSKVGRGNRRLDAIVLRCLAEDPTRRFASAAELREALTRPERSPLALIAAAGAVGLAIAAGVIWIEKPWRHAAPETGTQPMGSVALQPTMVASPPISPTTVASLPIPPTTQPAVMRGPLVEVGAGQLGQGQFVGRSPPWMWGAQMRQRPGFGNGQWLQDHFGADRVVEVDLQHVTEAQEKLAIAELQRDVGDSYSATMSGDQSVVRTAPCDDVAGLAARIHFGKVIEVDAAKGRIVVDMSSAGK